MVLDLAGVFTIKGGANARVVVDAREAGAALALKDINRLNKLEVSKRPTAGCWLAGATVKATAAVRRVDDAFPLGVAATFGRIRLSGNDRYLASRAFAVVRPEGICEKFGSANCKLVHFAT